MATNKGQTLHQHNDYKVQQEFERVARNTSSLSSTISHQTTGNGGGGTTNTEPTLWALTILKNGQIQLTNSDKKIVQVLDFIGNKPSGKFIDSNIYWEMTKTIPNPTLTTIPEAITIQIRAIGKVSVVDILETIKDYITQIVYGRKSITNVFDTGDKRLYLELINDEQTPDENKYYKVDESGNKGWHSTDWHYNKQIVELGDIFWIRDNYEIVMSSLTDDGGDITIDGDLIIL